MHKYFLVITLGTFLLILSACTKEVTGNTLVVGMECAYAPYNYITPNQTDTSVKVDGTNQYCDGYDVKIAQTIADELDYELVIKSLEWDGLIPALNTNQIDVIIAGMSPSEKRKLTIDFTDAYYHMVDATEQVVVVLENGKYKDAQTKNDFNGANIAAQLGTLQDEEGLIPQLTGANHATPLSDYPSLVTALVKGTIDGFIAESPVATHITNNNSNLKIIKFQDGEGFELSEAFTTTAIGLRKADVELKNEINEILATITTEHRTTWMNEFISETSE